MFHFSGKVVDWTENIAGHFDDLEARPAGSIHPHYRVSDAVRTSQEHELYVYHLADDQLGHGASLGNTSAWAETKGNADMLNLCSVANGQRMLGGLSVSYLFPFRNLSLVSAEMAGAEEAGDESGSGDSAQADAANSGSAKSDSAKDGESSSSGQMPENQLARAMPSSRGTIHLHPAYQQRQFVIGDGLHVLETFYLPRTDASQEAGRTARDRKDTDDPPAACTVIHLRNQTAHPIRIIAVASLDLHGHTPRDMRARWDKHHNVLLAHNTSNPKWVRFFGADPDPDHHWATLDEEEAFSPGDHLPDTTEGEGDLIGALEFDLVLAPGQSRKVRIFAGWSLEGEDDAAENYKAVRDAADHALNDTVGYYRERLGRVSLQVPDDMLTQGVQWAKACTLRPLAHYPIGRAFTNDPGNSSNIVGRDVAWYVHGSDFIMPDASYDLLQLLADHQRGDGLIAEFVNGLDGKSQYHGFNINDNTPLFLVAVCHHIKATGDKERLARLYPACRKAAELILACRDDAGLVRCDADGLGAKGICGWRNVLEHEQITGAVTEANSECFAALQAMATLAGIHGQEADAHRYEDQAQALREAINAKLIDPRTGLYMRNIDLEDRHYTQATVDMVFPLMFSVAGTHQREAIMARLFASDFMTEIGVRVLPDENPRYDPAGKAGCLGGVWLGATWWFAMGCTDTHPGLTADTLRRTYWSLVRDPRTFNTVPGQFNEWCDGRTLVNGGMRLSPWGPPRFLWTAVQGLAGVRLDVEGLRIAPRMPRNWEWLELKRLPHHGREVSFFVVREGASNDPRLFTAHDLDSDLPIEKYEQFLDDAVEPLTTGLTTSTLRRGNETLIFIGSSRPKMLMGPLLAHHAIDGNKTYEASRINSMDQRWQSLGRVQGGDVQRLAVRIEPRGYAMYRFEEVEK